MRCSGARPLSFQCIGHPPSYGLYRQFIPLFRASKLAKPNSIALYSNPVRRTDILFQQQNYGQNLKRSGAQIPGVTKGAPTQRYLTRVVRRITLVGALFLALVAIMPFLVGLIYPIGGNNTGLLLVSSAGLLIVVGVIRDTYRNIEAELKLRGYDSALLVR